MASVAKVILIGYLGGDVELRYLPDGTPVANFSVATSERKKQNGEWVESTTWFRISFFRKLAEVANQYLAKGKQVYVEGRLSQREWQDRDGNTRTSLEVTGTDLQFIGARDSGVAEEHKPQPRTPTVDDDVPF